MITLSHIFYNQHVMLKMQLRAWRSHPTQLLDYTLIDDGSPTPIPTLAWVNLRTFRVLEDIPWNIAGARNLAFHTAKTEWVLCADIDHIVTAEALAEIVKLDLTNPNVVYTFQRKSLDGYIGVDAVVNILMNREKFFEVGGYDEDYSGHYGREETFFLHCLRAKGVQRVHCGNIFLEWYPKLGSTRMLPRNKGYNAIIYDQKFALLRRGEYRNGPLLRFPWREAGV